MTRYLISFDDGSMAHIPDDDLPAVSEAAHAVVREAKDAGVWIHGGGVQRQRASIVGTDGVVVDGPSPETKAVIGGFSIIQVPTREDAIEWAGKFAVACRCAQEVRELGDDPEA
ncbi:MAG: YciI family protein [Burkholderiales bacterium]